MQRVLLSYAAEALQNSTLQAPRLVGLEQMTGLWSLSLPMALPVCERYIASWRPTKRPG